MNKNKYTRGFKVPENYFDSVEETILQRLDESELPEKSGFTTPEGYFDGLEDQLLDIVSTSEEQTGVISLISRRNAAIVLGIAACLAVIITVALNNDNASSDSFDLATVTDYIDEGYLELSTYEVSNLLEEEQLEELTLAPLTTEESIEDYLLEHIDENNLLIE